MTFDVKAARKFQITGNSEQAMMFDIGRLLGTLQLACDRIEELEKEVAAANSQLEHVRHVFGTLFEKPLPPGGI